MSFKDTSSIPQRYCQQYSALKGLRGSIIPLTVDPVMLVPSTCSRSWDPALNRVGIELPIRLCDLFPF